MAEWLKAHDSKSCGQQCLGGSNPLASARIKRQPSGLYFYSAREESSPGSPMPGRVSDDGALFISSRFRQTDDMKSQRDALAFSWRPCP